MDRGKNHGRGGGITKYVTMSSERLLKNIFGHENLFHKKIIQNALTVLWLIFSSDADPYEL